jgi:glycosyltransferase involved in cell wall biosynthesis
MFWAPLEHGMKIAVHAKVLSETQLAGIGVYTLNLLKALASIDQKNEYVLFTNQPLVHKIDAPNFREHLVRFPKFWSYLSLPFELMKGKFDLLFVPKEFVPPFIRPKTVITVYDLMGLRFAKNVSFDGKVHFWICVKYAIPAADAVLAISGGTKKDILEKCKVDDDKITVTHLGFNRDVFHQVTDGVQLAEIKKKNGLEGPYLINTSSLLWYRKNLVRLVEAFAAVKKRRNDPTLKLVITGKKGEAYEEIVTTAERLGVRNDLVLTGYIPLEDMPVLLSGAEALVFPSLDEGFGLPLIEAMACGCPVISSNCSAIPEVTGDAALLVEPEDVSAIAGAMEKVLSDPAEQSRLRALGLARAAQFSWEATARETLAVFEKTVGNKTA